MKKLAFAFVASIFSIMVTSCDWAPASSGENDTILGDPDTTLIDSVNESASLDSLSDAE